MKINEVLQTGREALSRCGVEPREARLLLAFAMNIKNDELINTVIIINLNNPLK